MSSLSVPVSPPNPARLEEGKKRLLALMGDCDCKLFLTSTEGKQLLNASFFRSEQTLLFVNTTVATHSLVPHDTTIYNYYYYKLNASIHNTRCSITFPTTHTRMVEIASGVFSTERLRQLSISKYLSPTTNRTRQPMMEVTFQIQRLLSGELENYTTFTTCTQQEHVHYRF